MNWSTIILGLVALSSVAMAQNSYLIMMPKLLKVGHDNQISVFIATASQPVVDIKFDLVFGQRRVEARLTLKAGETRNVTLAIPREFPVGAAELVITGTGGLRFEEHRDVIIYDSRHVLLVQTSASTYWPEDDMLIRVIAMNENLIPLEQAELNIEIYDAALKLVGEFQRVPVRSGLTEMLRFPLGSHINTGSWLVSAIMQNTTSSVEVLVARPVVPSFDLKAIFQRFFLRTDKVLRGVIEIDSDSNEPLFGRALVAISPITEQEIESKMQSRNSTESLNNEDWKTWKSQEFEIAGRAEINYDLLSLFNVDVSKAIAIQVYIKVTGLVSGHERVIRHIIPVFARDIMYDIRPLEFQSGIKNEFEVIAKRPDGKPIKMEDVIVSVRMIIGDEQGKQKDEQIMEIKDFYTRGRNDIGFFNLEIPQNVIGVLMTITPVDESGKIRGYRTRALPLMPMSRRRGANGAKLSIELLPSTVAPVNTNVNVPVISSQISTVGRTSNFYVQLIPSKPMTKFERLPMSYVLMTNGRITLSGEFHIEPTRECQTRTARAIRPEEQQPPMCLFNGTLPIQITRDMIPYSTLLVYTFQPSFGFNVAESYRFSVAGLFQNALTLNATIVPFTATEERVDAPMQWKDMSLKAMDFSTKVQDRTRVELSFTGAADSTIGLNVFEYDGVLQGLSNEITKERVLKHLTTYEQVPFTPMAPMESKMSNDKERRTISEDDEEDQIDDERTAYRTRFPVERLIFGVSSAHKSTPVEGDDIYTTSNMGRLFGDAQQHQSPSSHYRRKLEKSLTQYDVAVDQNDYVVATSMPMEFTIGAPKQMKQKETEFDVELNEQETPLHESSQRGTPTWFEKMHMKLNSVSQEAMTFMQSGITVVSDFESLRLPQEMKHENFTKLFTRLRQRSTWDRTSFSIRDDARLLLEEYIDQADLSMVPPPIMLEEQTRMGYYRSIFFNTSRIEAQGTGKVVLPRMKPYSTWLATGFALNAKSGLSVAQPIRLPTTQGLYILAHCVERVRVGERVVLAFAVNNYLGKDLNNVVVRIRRSADFDLYEQSNLENTISSQDKDYTFTVPSMKSWAVETRHLAFVPKRPGVIQLVMEVESEFGGDYEVVTVLVREPGMRRSQLNARLFDLTSEKKTVGPIVEKLVEANTRRPVQITVSGTGLDRFVNRHTGEINNLVGIDRALVQLYRSLGLRRYLNETNQANSYLFHMTTENITVAYQGLQVFHDSNGSYSLMSDEEDRRPSLYLTSLAFGAMISPMMPFRDDVVLNRTFNWIVSHQQIDGSFEDNNCGCYHYRFCSGEFRRESLTAMILYSLTRDNATLALPDYMRDRLYNGESSVVLRAQRYLESRVPAVRSNILVLSLFEIAFIQNPQITNQLREKIREAVLARKLTQDIESDSRFWKNTDERMTYDDQLLVNAMQVSLYAYFGDLRTALDIVRWEVRQLSIHSQFDTLFDAIMHTEAWLKTDCLFRRQFIKEKFAMTIDVTANNGEKKQFKIDANTIDVTQMHQFSPSVRQIQYSVSGHGLAIVRVTQKFVEEQQSKPIEPIPFQLTQELTPMKWLKEIKAKTCMTWTPTPRDLQLFPESFNRTAVIEIEIPSGLLINVRQVGFFLSRVPQVGYMTYQQFNKRLHIFVNMPSTLFGKQICLEWPLERLSTVTNWAPIRTRVYDYLQPERELFHLTPIHLQPSVLGYSFVKAFHEARPTVEELAKFLTPQQQQQQQA